MGLCFYLINILLLGVMFRTRVRAQASWCSNDTSEKPDRVDTDVKKKKRNVVSNLDEKNLGWNKTKTAQTMGQRGDADRTSTALNSTQPVRKTSSLSRCLALFGF